MCAHVCTHVCGGERTTSTISFDGSPPYMETGPLTLAQHSLVWLACVFQGFPVFSPVLLDGSWAATPLWLLPKFSVICGF